MDLRPLAFVVDDDQDFRNLMRLILKRLGVNSECFTTPEAFLQRLKETRPSICLIDLNLGRPGVGLQVVEAVRSVLGQDLPLFITSAQGDSESITRALELGANDFVLKPVEPALFAVKLSPYLKTDEISSIRLKTISPGGNGFEATIDLSFEVLELDEMGMVLSTPHLLPKGMALQLKGALLQEISPELKKSDRPILARVAASSTAPFKPSKGVAESPTYHTSIEFDASNPAWLKAVRIWLTRATATSFEESQPNEISG